MSIVAGELIREAYKLASVLGQSEEPQGFYAIQGINYLNQIISQWGSLGVYIPYENVLNIQLVSGQSEYTITPVITEILEANINTQNSSPNNAGTLSEIRLATPKEWNLFNPNFSSRPTYLYLSREQVSVEDSSGDVTYGSNLIFSPVPDSTYNVNLLLKYELQIVTLNQTLDQFPAYYIKPLKYQLAKDLSALFKTEMTPAFFDEYEKLMEELKAGNPSDLTIQNTNPFQQRRPFRPYNYYV